MANNVKGNPIYIDTEASVLSSNVDWYFQGVVITASGDNWAVVLEDSAGRVIFQAGTALANDRFKSFAPTSSVKVNGLVAKTLTNITSVLVYKGN